MQTVFKQNQPVFREGGTPEDDPFTVEGEVIEAGSEPDTKT